MAAIFGSNFSQGGGVSQPPEQLEHFAGLVQTLQQRGLGHVDFGAQMASVRAGEPLRFDVGNHTFAVHFRQQPTNEDAALAMLDSPADVLIHVQGQDHNYVVADQNYGHVVLPTGVPPGTAVLTTSNAAVTALFAVIASNIRTWQQLQTQSRSQTPQASSNPRSQSPDRASPAQLMLASFNALTMGPDKPQGDSRNQPPAPQHTATVAPHAQRRAAQPSPPPAAEAARQENRWLAEKRKDAARADNARVIAEEIKRQKTDGSTRST